MSALPVGEPVPLVAGTSYDVLASVSKSYSLADILKRVPQGVIVEDVREQGDGKQPPLGPDPNTSHRYVQAHVRVDRDAGELPWKTPWPLTVYHLVSASSSKALPNRPRPPNVWPWIGLVAAGAAALAWWKRDLWKGLSGRIMP